MLGSPNSNANGNTAKQKLKLGSSKANANGNTAKPKQQLRWQREEGG